MKRFWLAPLFLIWACYNPDLTSSSSPRYLCDDSQLCPDGLECVSGHCLRPGEMLDLSVPPIGDGGMTMAAAGCKSGQGFDLGGNMMACPGLFDKGGGAGLCATGYAPCTGMLSPMQQMACNRLQSRYFISAIKTVASSTSGSGRTHQCNGSGNYVALMGCGGTQYAIDTNLSNQCNQFLTALDCQSARYRGWEWMCDGSGIEGTKYNGSNGNAQDGVLCCK